MPFGVAIEEEQLHAALFRSEVADLETGMDLLPARNHRLLVAPVGVVDEDTGIAGKLWQELRPRRVSGIAVDAAVRAIDDQEVDRFGDGGRIKVIPVEVRREAVVPLLHQRYGDDR
jgi:hypothetical protein